MPVSSERQLVTFRGGFVADWAVVSRLLDLEARGARYVLLEDGRFRVVPPEVLTSEDVTFLKAHRADARAVIAYQADAQHLLADTAGPARRSMPLQQPHRSKQDYATPPHFLDAVRQRLGIDAFAVDFAADATNAKAPRFLDVAQNALTTSHWERLLEPGAWGWLNPPYTDIGPWARKCRETKEAGGQVAFLVPASVGANWYRDDVDGHALVLYLNGRLASCQTSRPGSTRRIACWRSTASGWRPAPKSGIGGAPRACGRPDAHETRPRLSVPILSASCGFSWSLLPSCATRRTAAAPLRPGHLQRQALAWDAWPTAAGAGCAPLVRALRSAGPRPSGDGR